ncbi:MAG: transcription antitermination factor NusB [Oscillospiraceae bacterium]
MAARQTALGVLIACRKQGAWSDGVMKEYAQRDRLDRREAALAARLCYGVLQNRMLLDYYLSQLVRGRLRDLQPVVLDILRLGLYQILCMDKIPDSAAVNEAVEQGKKYANSRAAGLINGVLRSAIRRRGALEEPLGSGHPVQPPPAPGGARWPGKWSRRTWSGCWRRTIKRRRRCSRPTSGRGSRGASRRHRKRRGQLCAAPLAGASAS